MNITQAIRDILGSNEAFAGKADQLSEDDSLFDMGLDSFGSVQLMLALEERFSVEFPDALLNRKSFATIRAIRDAVSTLVRQEAA
ncbi:MULTISPECIES: acyl carrier protein [Methylobacterium]|uniref:Acyl carrier protein n=1 Tax=Methylobacterium longum TaxID=767694 RepID=A0ABT8AW46_9HYPH|nr:MULTISPECIES: acyl carrier protein [Methylobacterium]MCJ2098280.1 acyl carrier protein [Methylobacterium sp. E-046]MDN3574192.1 acyl carrier protein [Methylobacterium longum]GJE11489.1 Aminoacyl carrier protein [Methylobacterium longum]